MTEYLKKSFSVALGNESYRNGWDAIDWTASSNPIETLRATTDLTDAEALEAIRNYLGPIERNDTLVSVLIATVTDLAEQVDVLGAAGDQLMDAGIAMSGLMPDDPEAEALIDTWSEAMDAWENKE